VRRYLEAIRAGKGDLDDREAAGELVDEVESLLQRVGSGTRIDDVRDEYKAACRALSAVLQRLGVAHANPYRDLWRFYRSWEEKQLSSYAAVVPTQASCTSPSGSNLTSWSGQGWSSRSPTNLAGIDARVRELRDAYALARSTN
jgi:hypothetical protein